LPKTKVTGEPKDGYLVRIELDEQSDRLVANAKIREYINPDTSSLKVKDRVKAVIYKSTNLGYSCIINGQFDGLLYRDESFSLKVGDEKTLFIKNIREDGKLDLIIDKDEKLDEQKEIVLKKLRAKMGYLPFTYKSDSDEISRYFGISKKAFKRVLTELIEDKKIELKDDGIYKYRQDAKEN
jgi:hypothetical protein